MRLPIPVFWLLLFYWDRATGFLDIPPDYLMKKNFSELQENGTGELCPLFPVGLSGELHPNLLADRDFKELDVIKDHPELLSGGSWRPEFCIARFRVAVVIPFRDRQSHLSRLLGFLIPILQRQFLNFRFIVTEQYGHELFNKGKIMNAAFLLAEKLRVDCLVFHDVDMFPETDKIYYGCYDQPMHLGAYVNVMKYDLWYWYITGGVLSIRTDHFHLANGYSTEYWGWGGEDDDMGQRLAAVGLRIYRLSKTFARYTMLKHKKRKRIKPRLVFQHLAAARSRRRSEGLNTPLLWKILKLELTPLYYHLWVNVGALPPEWNATAPNSMNVTTPKP